MKFTIIASIAVALASFALAAPTAAPAIPDFRALDKMPADVQAQFWGKEFKNPTFSQDWMNKVGKRSIEDFTEADLDGELPEGHALARRGLTSWILGRMFSFKNWP